MKSGLQPVRTVRCRMIEFIDLDGRPTKCDPSLIHEVTREKDHYRITFTDGTYMLASAVPSGILAGEKE